MKHLEHTLTTYMYSYCNMCNIPIYFCNIQMKTYKIIKTYTCNMHFQCNVTLQLDGMEAHRCGARCQHGGRRWRMELVGAAVAPATRHRGSVTRSSSIGLGTAVLVVPRCDKGRDTHAVRRGMGAPRGGEAAGGRRGEPRRAKQVGSWGFLSCRCVEMQIA
jgi:hypothetical protein